MHLTYHQKDGHKDAATTAKADAAGAPRQRQDSQEAKRRAIIAAGSHAERSLGGSSRLDGYRMLESFEIENFKCFDSLKLSDLKRVNIVTGDNASGKTALLEAVYAAAKGNAEALLQLNQLRGIVIGNSPLIPGLPMTISPAQFPVLWSHWFYVSKQNGTATNKITFRYTDTDKKTYVITFSIGAKATTGPIFSGVVPFTVSRSVTAAGGQPRNTTGLVSVGPQGQMQATGPLPDIGPSSFLFTAALNYAEADNVRWFSQLREKGGTQEIVDFFKKTFPFIQNLEVLAPSGTPALAAALSSGEVRPLQLVSSGIHKIISILLACASARNGVILIDEIENGLFYDKYELTWYVLNKFSKEHNCQLFITSHSAECLRALVPIMGDDVASFSLMRTERENGKCKVRHISGASMKAALKREGEIRGGSPSGSSH